MKILIFSQNSYLMNGLLHLLPPHPENEISLASSSIGNLGDLSDFDTLIIDIQHYQQGLCFEAFKTRKKTSQLFFVQSGRKALEGERFLRCCEDAVVLQRDRNVGDIKNLIMLESAKPVQEKKCLNASMCDRCFYPYLTSTQLLILIGLKNGYSAKLIASALSISNKTVFSHLYKMRSKFNLESDLDIKKFLENDLKYNKPIKAN